MIPIKIPTTPSILPLRKRPYEKENFKICPQFHFQLLQTKNICQDEAAC
jgi:hypothetical protein